MTLTIPKLLGVVLAAMFGGAGLLMLLFGSAASLYGDDAAAGCMSMGLALLAAGGLIAVGIANI